MTIIVRPKRFKLKNSNPPRFYSSYFYYESDSGYIKFSVHRVTGEIDVFINRKWVNNELGISEHKDIITIIDEIL